MPADKKAAGFGEINVGELNKGPSMKKIILLTFVIIIIGAVCYFSPYFAINGIKKAINNNDPDALSDYIDYPSLKESLKQNFNALIAKESLKNSDGNSFEILGATLAAAATNSIVDNFISPESITMLLKGQTTSNASRHEDSKQNNNSFLKQEKKTVMKYGSRNRFEVIFEEEKPSTEKMKLIFRRHGLFSWKLSNIRLPLKDMLSDIDKPKVAEKKKPKILIDPQSLNGKFLSTQKAGLLFVITGEIKGDCQNIPVKISGELVSKTNEIVQEKTVYCGNIISEEQLKKIDMLKIDQTLIQKKAVTTQNEKERFMIVFDNLAKGLENFSVKVVQDI